MTKDTVARQTHHIDATGIPLGRLATQIATLLRGKQKPNFVPHLDQGDAVVVTQARKVVLTGRKYEQKTYHWHTGYIGHLKTRTAREILAKRPAELIERAVFGMLPKNRLRAKFMRRLKVYPDAEPESQNEQNKEINSAEER